MRSTFFVTHYSKRKLIYLLRNNNCFFNISFCHIKFHFVSLISLLRAHPVVQLQLAYTCRWGDSLSQVDHLVFQATLSWPGVRPSRANEWRQWQARWGDLKDSPGRADSLAPSPLPSPSTTTIAHLCHPYHPPLQYTTVPNTAHHFPYHHHLYYPPTTASPPNTTYYHFQYHSYHPPWHYSSQLRSR